MQSTSGIEPNVVLGITSSSFLMLDCDLQMESFVREFADRYGDFHELGSHLIMLTSKSTQRDLFGNGLGNYAIIFGRHVDNWSDIQWHISECKRLGIINRGFASLREFGSITIRTNAKNFRTPAPEIVEYHSKGEDTGCEEYLKTWRLTRNLGMKDTLNCGLRAKKRRGNNRIRVNGFFYPFSSSH